MFMPRRLRSVLMAASIAAASSFGAASAQAPVCDPASIHCVRTEPPALPPPPASDPGACTGAREYESVECFQRPAPPPFDAKACADACKRDIDRCLDPQTEALQPAADCAGQYRQCQRLCTQRSW